jgi:hypothetical protein
LNKSAAANLSLVVVVVGWSGVIYGLLANFGDYVQLPLPSVLEERDRFARLMLIIGVASLIVSLGLAGYAFRGAKRRASVAVAAAVVGLFVCMEFGWLQRTGLSWV